MADGDSCFSCFGGGRRRCGGDDRAAANGAPSTNGTTRQRQQPSTASQRLPAITPVGGTQRRTAAELKNDEDAFFARYVGATGRDQHLGTGASCTVRRVIDTTGGAGMPQFRTYALKSLPKFGPNGLAIKNSRQMYTHEVRVLHLLGRHANVVHLYDDCEGPRHFHLVLECLSGGELYERAVEGAHSERTVAAWARDMLGALSHLHSKNVVHRDVKPENFLLETRLPHAPLRMIDFGCALVVKDNENVEDAAGSVYYVAPEILDDRKKNGQIWRAADMWSMGVVIYLLCTGRPPFNDANNRSEAIYAAIKRGTFRFPDSPSLSPECRSLITRLLTKDVNNRLTATEALADPWVSGDAASSVAFPDSVRQGLSAFGSYCALQRVVARVVALRMGVPDVAALEAVFRDADKNGDGQLGFDEIVAMMRKLGRSEAQAKDEAQRLMDSMDEDHSQTIGLEEFKTGVIISSTASDKNKIKAAFDLFDIDHNGEVTRDEMEKMCDGVLPPHAIVDLINSVDVNGDGKINFAEFLRGMQGGSAGASMVDPLAGTLVDIRGLAMATSGNGTVPPTPISGAASPRVAGHARRPSIQLALSGVTSGRRNSVTPSGGAAAAAAAAVTSFADSTPPPNSRQISLAVPSPTNATGSTLIIAGTPAAGATPGITVAFAADTTTASAATPQLLKPKSIVPLASSGKVRVTIIKGTIHKPFDANGLADPYVEVGLQNTPSDKVKWSFKTKRRDATLTPEWNEDCVLEYKQVATAMVHLRAYDWDRFSRNDFIGAGSFSLTLGEHDIALFDEERRQVYANIIVSVVRASSFD